jgi:Predicted metal-dependent hydrolase
MITSLLLLQDTELGEIVFRKNSRAKHYIIRCKNGTVFVTLPRLGNLKEAKLFFLKNREKLIPAIRKIRERMKEQKTSISPEEITLLKQEAIDYLPSELKALADQYGFHYQTCKIGKSKTHWGSCSFTGTIRLSIYLMRLPKNLIHYVLLHELCHTVHHNHKTEFWILLDQCTNGQAKQLRKSLRQHSIPLLR